MPDMRRLLLHRMPALNNIARLPWIKGNIRKLEKGGSLWEPSRLFDNGEQGAWYDPSDLSTMFQDSAGTTPVTADGQPVGKILDKSGRGNHASQATAAKRPLYKTDGTYHWLQFDGVDDSLATAAINFTATDKMSVFSGQARAVTTAAIVVELSSDVNTNNGSLYLLTGSDAAAYYSSISRGTVGLVGGQIAKWAPNNGAETVVITATHDISGDLSRIRRNGVYGTDGLSDKGAGNFGSYPLFIGSRNSTSLRFNGRIYSLILRGAASTSQEITDTETWVNGKTGAY